MVRFYETLIWKVPHLCRLQTTTSSRIAFITLINIVFPDSGQYPEEVRLQGLRNLVRQVQCGQEPEHPGSRKPG